MNRIRLQKFLYLQTQLDLWSQNSERVFALTNKLGGSPIESKNSLIQKTILRATVHFEFRFLYFSLSLCTRVLLNQYDRYKCCATRKYVTACLSPSFFFFLLWYPNPSPNPFLPSNTTQIQLDYTIMYLLFIIRCRWKFWLTQITLHIN